MSFLSSSKTVSEQWGQTVPALGLVTERHRAALQALHRAADNDKPLIFLIAEGKFEANHVLGAFLSSFDEKDTVIRLTKPYRDSVEGMREINRALGFEPKDLSLSDLDKILEMFLAFQKKHRRRTVLCVEQAHLQSRWLLEHVRFVLELEAEGDFGLLVILAGQASVKDLLATAPLVSILNLAARPVHLQPFSQSETMEFLRQRVRDEGAADISQLFEFDAIERIHELSGGVPDLVGTLYSKCRQISREQGAIAISEDLVVDAAKHLWQKPGIQARVEITDVPEIGPTSVFREKLDVRLRGAAIKEISLKPGRYLVGRAGFADICLTDEYVSRRHALIIKSKAGVSLLDLGSTNGTLLNGLRFTGDQPLSVGDVISIGEYQIEFRV